jgi:hypothetical protein
MRPPLCFLAHIAVAWFLGASGANALTIDDRARFWTANNNEVPICFSNGNQDWGEVKKYIRELLVDSWEFNSTIRFTKYDRCDGGNDDARVRVLVKKWDQGNWYGKSYGLGMGALRSGQMQQCESLTGESHDGCVWSVIFFVPSNATGNLSAGDRRALRYLVVHEFGHILGFAHEQDTDRNFNFVNGSTQPGSIIPVPTTEIYCRPASKDIAHHRVWTTGFDADSIMVQGYCEGGVRRTGAGAWNPGPTATTGRLSRTDVSALQLIYGKPDRSIMSRRRFRLP